MSTRILHLTDTHLHADPAFMHMGVNTRQSLLDVLDHVRHSSHQADLILITGDLTHDETAAGYQQLRSILDSLSPPIYVLPGNHDEPGLLAEHLLTSNISNQTRIAHENWQIIMLDSSRRGSECGELAASQLELLNDALTQHPHLDTLVCMHHQPIPVGSRWLDTMQISNNDAFMRVIQPHPQLRGVLWGHIHQAFIHQQDSVHWIATPATCRQFLPGSRDFAIDASKGAGYRWLELRDKGSIHSDLVWLEP